MLTKATPLFVFLCGLILSVSAEAQSATPPASCLPATYFRATVPESKFRPDFKENWQRDYLWLVYDAQSGRISWWDYSSKEDDQGEPLQLSSPTIFTPVSFTSEKIMILVCNAHFGATAMIVPDTQAVPDASSQSANVDSIAAPEHIKPAYAGKNDCVALDQALQDAEDALIILQQALAAYSKQAEAVPGAEDQIQQIVRMVQKAEQNETFVRNNINTDQTAKFNSAVQNVRNAYTALTSLMKATAGVSDKLKASLDSVAKAAEQLRTKRATLDLIEPETCKTISVKARYTNFYNTIKTLSVPEPIEKLNRKIVSLQFKLNEDHDSSSIGMLKYLGQATTNSLTQVSITVSDPWVPFVIADPAKNKPSGKKDTATTITIDSTNKTKTILTVNPPDGAPGDVSVNSGVTNVDGMSNPIVSVQTTTTPSPQKPKTAKGDVANAPLAPTAPSRQPDASVFIERHRIVHFVPSGGFLYAAIPSRSFQLETFPSLTTVTTTSQSTTTITSGPNSITPTSPVQTTSAPTATSVSTPSTSTYVYQAQSDNFQVAAILGVKWYIFGHDSFSVTRSSSKLKQPSIGTYADQKWYSPIGIFLGTSVNTLGDFVIAPTYEKFPGIDFFAGFVLGSKTSLKSGVIGCTNPTPLTTSNTVTLPTVTSATNGSDGTIVTTTVTGSVTTAITNGCSTPNATIFSGSTAPTTTSTVPGFGFGVLLNSNIFKYFGLGK